MWERHLLASWLPDANQRVLKKRLRSRVFVGSLLALCMAAFALGGLSARGQSAREPGARGPSADDRGARVTDDRGARVTRSAKAKDGPRAGIGALVLGAASLPKIDRYAQLIVSPSLARQASFALGESRVYFAGTDVNEGFSTGVSYTTARSRGWLLKAADGTFLKNRDFPSNYIGDVGNPAYARAWVKNVTRFLRRYGNDGVMIDDVLRDIEPLAGQYPAKYPNQPSWQAATHAFIAIVGSQLRKEHYYVAANATGYTPGDPRSNDGTLDIAWWTELAPYVDGLVNESYQQRPNDHALRSSQSGSDGSWDGWQRLVHTAESLGKDFIGITYGGADDTRTMLYGRASFLLDWNGGASTFIYNTTDSSNPWNTTWTRDVGKPVFHKQRLGVGWLRQYSAGVALVNPDSEKSQLFRLHGRYRDSSGAIVTQLTLPPTSGEILRKVPRN